MAFDLEHLAAQLAAATVSTVTIETNFLPPITIDVAKAIEGPPGITALLQPRLVISGPALGEPVELAPYGLPKLSGIAGVSIGVLVFAGLLVGVFMLGRASK